MPWVDQDVAAVQLEADLAGQVRPHRGDAVDANHRRALPTVRRVLNMPAADQALLVSLAPGARLGDVAPRIRAVVPDSAVYGTAEFVARVTGISRGGDLVMYQNAYAALATSGR